MEPVNPNKILDPMNVNIPEIEDVGKSTNTYIRNYILENKSFMFMLLFGLIFISLLTWKVFGGLFGLIFIILPAFFLIYSNIQSKIKRQFTQQFGVSIGFSYSQTAGTDSVSGKLFSTGRDRVIYDVLIGIHDGLPMRIFSYRFTIGSGKSSQTFTYTVFEVTLMNKVPNILLLSNSHSSQISEWFSGDETVKLEGDFNNYFKLRVPKEYEMEAYQLFTPDVMADLIDRARDFSFEFVADKLYIYATEIVTNRQKLDAMFALVTYLDNLFRKNASGVDI